MGTSIRTIDMAATALGSIDDVTITSVADGDFLQYSSGSSAWVNNTNVTMPGTVGVTGLLTAAVGATLTTGNLTLVDTTTATTGVIMKGTDRFIHNFHHPTGGGALPDGFNTNIGVNAGNLTMGSTATNTIHASSNSNFGYNAGQALTTGYNNSNFGRSSGTSLSTGFYNSNFGNYAGLSLTTGNTNVCFGQQAGRYIADGSTPNQTTNTSCFIGAETRASADGVANENVFGYGAIGQGSNTCTFGNTSVTSHVFPAGNISLTDGALTANKPGIATTETNGVELINDTASLVGVTVEQSPSVYLKGSAWDTDGSASADQLWRFQNVPVTGNTPSSNLIFEYNRSGGGWTEGFRLEDDGGVLVANGLILTAGNMGLIDGNYTANKPAIGETVTYGVELINATDSTVSNDEYSPALYLQGGAWDTDGSANVDKEWRSYIKSTAGNTSLGPLVFESQTGGGGWNERVRFGELGDVTVANGLTLTTGAMNTSKDAITATSDGVAASVTSVVTEITTNGDSDLDNVTLANGTDGQVKMFSVVAVGNAADSVKITPASMVGGTQITFAANPLGLGCTMAYDSSTGWVVVGNNGGTVS